MIGEVLHASPERNLAFSPEDTVMMFSLNITKPNIFKNETCMHELFTITSVTHLVYSEFSFTLNIEYICVWSYISQNSSPIFFSQWQTVWTGWKVCICVCMHVTEPCNQRVSAVRQRFTLLRPDTQFHTPHSGLRGSFNHSISKRDAPIKRSNAWCNE